MEVLAISGLAYLGTILNQHIISEYDNKGRKEHFNSKQYQTDEKKEINKKYNKRVKEINIQKKGEFSYYKRDARMDYQKETFAALLMPRILSL